jgi:SAUR family protein
MERTSRRSAIISKISQIVKTKRITRQWHKLAAIPLAITGIKPAPSMRFSDHYHEGGENKISRETESRSRGIPGDVSVGHLAVYAGKEEEVLERFVIPVTYLNHQLFLKLLRNAEEEFGFDYPNARLTIPCDPALLASIIDVVRDNGNHDDGVGTANDQHRSILNFCI